MSTAHKSKEEKKEHFDPPEVFEKKCQQLAQWIKESKHFVAFTGAGISTSAGIADFRSGADTVLPTGPGCWEREASKVSLPPPKVEIAYEEALPTRSHMSLVALEQKGLLKYLISQNCDGLHLRSGMPADKLSELHGNMNLEICSKCGNRYLRDFDVCTEDTLQDHLTGRLCDDPKCRGKLRDSIIHFGENLPQKAMELGFENSEIADLHLCLGSSLRVTPAADMPDMTADKGGKLVIVNLQKTPLNKKAKLVIHGLIDDVMQRVMKILDIPIPDFVLTRRFCIFRTKPGHEKGEAVMLRGVDAKGNPYSFLTQVVVSFLLQKPKSTTRKNEPFVICNEKADSNAKVKISLEFQGHYEEPDFDFEFDLSTLKPDEGQFFELKYSPLTQKWFQFEKLK